MTGFAQMMAPPAIDDRDVRSLHALLRVIADPEATRRQLDLLAEQTKRALEVIGEANDLMSAAICLYLAYLKSFLAILLTLIFPFFGQLFWIFSVWMATGVFFNALTIACLVWIALAVLAMIFITAGEKK